MQENWNQAYKEKNTPWRKTQVNLEYFKNIVPKGKVLDVGCGTGEHAKWFHDNGYQVTGIDFSSEAISIAQKENPGPNYIIFDIDSFIEEKHGLGVIGEKYDIVWDVTCYQFLNNKTDYLNSVKKIMSGIFVIQVVVSSPNPEINTDIKELEKELDKRFTFEKRTHGVGVTYICR